MSEGLTGSPTTTPRGITPGLALNSKFLSRGATGKAVRELQRDLLTLGFLSLDRSYSDARLTYQIRYRHSHSQ